MKRILTATLFIVILASWTFQNIKLEKKQVLNDKVEILLPKNFGIMSEEMLQLKYPSANRPTLVYSDEDGTVNIAFNHTTSRASQKEIEKYKDVFVSTFKSSYPTAVWGEKGVKEINGRKVGFLEVTTPAIDTKIYNLLFFTDMEGKLLICTFNCTSKKKSAWAESAKKIFGSLIVK